MMVNHSTFVYLADGDSLRHRSIDGTSTVCGKTAHTDGFVPDDEKFCIRCRTATEGCVCPNCEFVRLVHRHFASSSDAAIAYSVCALSMSELSSRVIDAVSGLRSWIPKSQSGMEAHAMEARMAAEDLGDAFHLTALVTLIAAGRYPFGCVSELPLVISEFHDDIPGAE